MMKKSETKESLFHYVDSVYLVDLVSVSKRMVFVHDKENNLFSAKLKIVNQSPRYVSYQVRSSNKDKFKIYPRYGSINPRETIQVLVSTTPLVQDFKDVCKESFCVFAVPIYDKRQLSKKSLSVLWKAHGSALFPADTTECHRIPYVLPSSDTYFDNLSMLERLCKLSHVFSWGKDKLEELTNLNGNVDPDTFYLHWPSQKRDDIDPSMADMISDWNKLAKKCQIQTQAIVENTKVAAGVLLSGVAAIGVLSYLTLSGKVGLFNNPNHNTIEDDAENPGIPSAERITSTVFGWIRNWWEG